MAGAARFDEEGRLALDDPLWRRFQGVYGPDDVSGGLRRLLASPNEDQAEAFIDCCVSHPGVPLLAAWAAFPWIWQIARTERTVLEMLSILLHDGYTAGRDGEDAYSGQSSDLREDAGYYLRHDLDGTGRRVVRAADIPALRRIRETCLALLPEVDAACIAASGGLDDIGAVEDMLAGPCALRGIDLPDMRAEQVLRRSGIDRLDRLHARHRPDAAEASALWAFAREVAPASPAYAGVLRDIAMHGEPFDMRD